jgi:soluble lytic murein transglycosylase-like protein/TolA-binding protein
LLLAAVTSGVWGPKLALPSLDTVFGSTWEAVGRLFQPGVPTTVFNGKADVTLADARARFAMAVGRLGKHADASLKTLEALMSAYPGLQPTLRLRIAEANALQGNEAEARRVLGNLLRDSAHSHPLRPWAQYRIGQSWLRQAETADNTADTVSAQETAETAFLKVQRQWPKSEVAVGSHYYLGLLALKAARQAKEATERDVNTAKSIHHWRAYLEASPKGRFAGEILPILDSLLPTPSPPEQAILGVAYFKQGLAPEKALAHLAPAEKAGIKTDDVWLALARLRYRTAKLPDEVTLAREGLLAGLKHTASPRAFSDGLSLLLSQASAPEVLLERVLAMDLRVGADEVHWQLMKANPLDAPNQARLLVDQYPTSRFSPEAHWTLLWPTYPQAAFIPKAQRHLRLFAHSRSVPKVRFWLAKCYEMKGQRQKAQAQYQQILLEHPLSYYAFRAQARLQAPMAADMGWQLLAQASLPSTLDVPPPPLQGFANLSPAVAASMQELAAIAAQPDLGHTARQAVLEDLERMLPPLQPAGVSANDAGASPPPYLVAWHAWMTMQKGQPQVAIGQLRSALDPALAAATYASLASDKALALPRLETLHPRRDLGWLKILYPTPYGALIERYAAANRLHPLLVLALMREESHFYPAAASSSQALGLMQLLPATAREVARQVYPGRPFEVSMLWAPEHNIALGTRYLREAMLRFQARYPASVTPMLAVGSYNGGPNAVLRWAERQGLQDPDVFVENIPYEETRNYIKKVFGTYWTYHQLLSQSGH